MEGNKMRKTAIVTGGTRKDVSAMGVLALNIKKITPNLADELIIFHDGISKKDREVISNIFPTKFYKYRFHVGWLNKRKSSSLRYFSTMVFCKYECFRLLEEYDSVIWTDYDIVILKDLTELHNSMVGMQIFESSDSLGKMFYEKYRNMEFAGYDMDSVGLGTPLFVLRKSIGDYMKYYQWCKKTTLEYAPYIYLPEQCIFTMLVQKFHIEYESLSNEKYVASPREDNNKEDISIIHAAGRPKFWEGLRNEQWEDYYEEWIHRGGSKYKKPLKEKLIKSKEDILAIFGWKHDNEGRLVKK